MTHLRQRMLEDMQLKGFAERTQECYTRSVRQLSQHYNKPPAQISEEELRKYFLHIKNVKKWKRATVTIALCGIKFFYTQTLERQWTLFDLVRPQRERRLPVILTREEIRRILKCVRFPIYRVCLLTMDSTPAHHRSTLVDSGSPKAPRSKLPISTVNAWSFTSSRAKAVKACPELVEGTVMSLYRAVRSLNSETGTKPTATLIGFSRRSVDLVNTMNSHGQSDPPQ